MLALFSLCAGAAVPLGLSLSLAVPPSSGTILSPVTAPLALSSLATGNGGPPAAAAPRGEPAPDPVDADGWTGTWAGTVEVSGAPVGLRLHLRDDGASARWSMPHFGWYDQPARVRGEAELAVDWDVYGARVQLQLARNGDSLHGRWSGWGADATVQLGRSTDPRAAHVEESFDFDSDGFRLRGTLLLPCGEGPFPAIVWTHGSGRITREDPIYRSLAVWAVEHGIASLIYDKRPPTPDATMQVLGADAVAGVESLVPHPDIVADRIGVGGMSQGGWVSPIAASLSERVAFVVGLSAPGVSPAEQNLFNQHNKVRNAGFSEDVAEESSGILQRIYGYLRTGDEKAEVWAELERAREQPWFSAAYELPIWHRQGLPPAPWQHRDALDFDPSEIWRAIEVPVLCLWGADDLVVPPFLSRERIDAWLEDSGNTVRELRCLEGATHDLRLPPAAPWSQGAIPVGANVLGRFVHGLAGPPAHLPPTRRSEVTKEHHGTDVPDPYQWLEASSNEVTEWARAQDEATLDRLANDVLFDELRERMIELSQYARAPVPVFAGGHEFHEGQYPGEYLTDLRVRVQGEGDDAWRVLVDPKNHPASPNSSVALGPPRPSPDGRYLLYGASSSSLPSCLRMVEVESGEELGEESLPAVYWPWVVSWLADSSGVLYVDGTRVRLHQLWTSPREDPVIYHSTSSPAPHLGVRAGRDGTHWFVTEYHPDGESSRVFVGMVPDLDAEPTDAQDSALLAWRELVPDLPGAHQLVGQDGDTVFLYTTTGAPRGRVMTVDLAEPSAPWSEVVPEYAEPIYDENHPMRPTVGLFGDRIASMYPREGRVLLRIHDLAGGLRHELEREEFGFTESGLVGDPHEPVVRFDEASIFDRGTAFEVNLHTGERRQLGEPIVPFDRSEFVFTREAYRSFDGTEVPIYLAHREALVRDGTNPVLVINWATSGLVVRPLYMASYHAWMELGGVLALPAARGGGEYGEPWHRAGVGVNKRTAIDDLGAAADWLAATGISRADRIAMLGSSMNGPASAGALVRHRDSFGAGLFQIPRIDLLASRGWWAEEYGDIAVEPHFRAMMEWLPLQNAHRGWYPPSLVQVGSRDNVAPPFHGYKLTAALQHAQRGRDETLLQVVWGAGHSQGSGVPKRSETLALQYTWLARVLGMED